MKENFFGRTIPFAMVLIFILTTIGCGGGNTPIAPDPVMQDGAAVQNPAEGNRILIGMWQAVVDLESGDSELIPLRDSEAHINILAFLEMEVLTGFNVDIDTLVIDTDNGLIEVDIILRHPLPGYTEYTLFDVRGIIITNGSQSGLSIDESIVYPGPNESRLVNADGYTRWWNPREFQGWGLLAYIDGLLGMPDSVAQFGSIINGYKYYGDGLGLDDEVMQPILLQGRARFSTTSILSRHFSIKFGPDVSDYFVFNYAVDASWEPPLNVPPLTLDDFPPEANSLEPFNINVTETNNSLYYDPELVDCPTSGGVLRLSIDVATWQGIAGISEVMVGSPDLGIDFQQAYEVGGYDLYHAHISTYTAEFAPDDFSSHAPEILIEARSAVGSYETGPAGLETEFGGPEEANLAMYQIHETQTETNSPPQVGPVIGPMEVQAGESHTYLVEYFLDCQDMSEDLVFHWETGGDNPNGYDEGYGNTNTWHPYGDGSIGVYFPYVGMYFIDCMVEDLEGKMGFSQQLMFVNATLPDPPIFESPNVNLVISLHRSMFFSYEYATNPFDIPYLQLDWDASEVTGNIAEWVIYTDTDPYDGEENWEALATTEPGFTSYQLQLTGEPGYNSGGAYYFKVKARSVPGDAASDSLGQTELAFIEFENAEPDSYSMDQHPWEMGYGGVPSSHGMRQWERPGYGGAVSGGCWVMDPDSDYMDSSLWSVIGSPELPILTDPVLAATTEEWYIELIFGAKVIPMNECWDNYARLSVGTVPDSPTDHTGDYYYIEYNEAHPDDYIEGTPYYTAGYWSRNNQRFDETLSTYTDRYGWGKAEYAFPYNLSRFRLNDLDPNGTARTRAAIGFGSGTGGSGYFQTYDAHSRPRVDEIAVIIY